MDDLLSKTLITGAGGMMGSYVDFGIPTDRRTLDITNPRSIAEAFTRYRPAAVIHLAAYTDVEGCEREPERAYMVNTIGTAQMAHAARTYGAKFVYVSTGGVFDGAKDLAYTPEDQPNPQTTYGKSKYFGELVVQSILPDAIIARVCWVFGGGPAKDKKFFGKIMKQLMEEKKETLMITNDVRGTPTFAKDAVGLIAGLLVGGKAGIFHVANEGVCTRYEFAKEVARIFAPAVTINAVSSKFFNPNASPVPNESLASTLGSRRPWQVALDEYARSEWRSQLTHSL